jgi:3-deoxy-D-manno-octulosonic-acid transferase
MWLGYSLLVAIGLALYIPFLGLRRLARGRYQTRLAERAGRFGPGLPPEPRWWIHAVSVGESLTAIPLVEALRGRWPEMGVLFTTVTPTGAQVVADRLGSRVVHRFFPLDLPGPVGRAVDSVRPRFFIAMETELWPNFLGAICRRGIPSMIANGRISDRSFRRYRLVRPFMRRVLQQVTVFAMQSEEYARRIKALGAPAERVFVTGSLKAESGPPGTDEAPPWREVLALPPENLVWIAGSTHRGEEALVLDVHRRLAGRIAGLTLILAPRHPERVAEVERLAGDRGLRSVRRSAIPTPRPEGAIVVVDTVGELASIYAVADLVFVGGSLVPAGGHNVLEPAIRKKPVLFGPHVGNFRESAELLIREGAACSVEDAAALERALERLLGSAELRRRMGMAGFEAVRKGHGAVEKTLALVERFLVPAGALR